MVTRMGGTTGATSIACRTIRFALFAPIKV